MLEFIDLEYQQLSNDYSQDLYSLRKKVFKDRLNWAVACNNEMEFDEYDNKHTTYLRGIYKGNIICSVRFINIKYHNMIVGTFYKNFESISLPSGNYAEASRLFVDKKRLSELAISGSNYPISNMLFLSMIQYAKKMGYDGIYAIVSHQMFIIFKRSGWNVSAIERGISEKNEYIYLIFMPLDENSTVPLRKKFTHSYREWPLSFPINKA